MRGPKPCVGSIEVKFRDTDAGWLWFDVQLDRTILTFSATAIVDSFPRLLESLEAVVDRQRAWFLIWEEGQTSGFVLEPRPTDEGLVDVKVYRGSDENVFGVRTENELVSNSDVYFSGTLSSRAFVKAFHHEIRRFLRVMATSQQNGPANLCVIICARSCRIHWLTKGSLTMTS